MKSVSEVVGQRLLWVQPPAFQQQYQLQLGEDGGEELARLEWRSNIGTFAAGATAEGSWTFKRVGFVNQRVTIRQPDSEEDFGVFKPSWTYQGTLSLPGAPNLKWVSGNFWQTRWKWTTENDLEIMAFEPKRELQRVTRTESYLDINPEAATTIDPGHLGLLTVFGWYLIILAQNDSGTAGGIVGAIS